MSSSPGHLEGSNSEGRRFGWLDQQPYMGIAHDNHWYKEEEDLVHEYGAG